MSQWLKDILTIEDDSEAAMPDTEITNRHIRSVNKEKLKIRFVHEGLEIENLRAIISENDDITINGRVIRQESVGSYEDMEVVTDLLNENSELLLSLHSYKSFNFNDNPIEAFSCFCADTKRFFEDEIATIEIYTRVKRGEI